MQKYYVRKQDIFGILEAEDRTKAGKTLPPQGLYLVSVNYDC